MQDKYRDALHETSNVLTREQKQTLKGGVHFSPSDENTLEMDPHKFLHILLQHQNEDFEDLCRLFFLPFSC